MSDEESTFDEPAPGLGGFRPAQVERIQVSRCQRICRHMDGHRPGCPYGDVDKE